MGFSEYNLRMAIVGRGFEKIAMTNSEVHNARNTDPNISTRSVELEFEMPRDNPANLLFSVAGRWNHLSKDSRLELVDMSFAAFGRHKVLGR